MLHHFAAGRVDCSLDDRFVLTPVHSNLRIEELIASLVAREKDQAPDEVCEETADEHHDQYGQSLPKFGGTVLQGESLNRIARCQAISEARAHDPGENSDANPFSQIELLNCSSLLLG